MNRNITPWEHAGKDGFFQYKAHLECHRIFEAVKADFDYLLPVNLVEWEEMVEWEKIEGSVEEI